ncbi:MAG: tol-pal system protein YbgF [Bdellovibrionales bacterium]
MKRILAIATITLLATTSLAALAQQSAPQSGAGLTATQVETRLSDMEDQMRAINGQVEQLSYALRRMDQTLQRLQGDYDQRLSKLEESVVNITAAAAAAKNAAARQQQALPHGIETPPMVDSGEVDAPPPVAPTRAGTLGALKMQDGKVTGGNINPQAPPLPDTPPDYGLTSQEQYTHAFELLRQANYGDAEKAFKSFIEKNPQDKLIENAKYWYAETLYVRGNFSEAASAFADSFQQNAKGSKAPDSLLKLSLSLAAINKNPDACTVLSELKSKYPTSSASIKSRAAELRTKLKCSSK